MIDQTSEVNITEASKVPDQDNRFRLPALKLPLNLNKGSAMLSPTAMSTLSIDQYVTSGRDDEEKLDKPTRKRGNASTLRPVAYQGGLDSLLNLTDNLHPKVSYSDLRKLYGRGAGIFAEKK
jgi:hypothetical protein